MDELANPIHNAAGVGVVEATKHELRNMHIGSCSADFDYMSIAANAVVIESRNRVKQ